MTLQGSNQPNPKYGTFCRVNDLVSQQIKGIIRGVGYEGAIIDVKTLTRQNSQVNKCTLFGSLFDQQFKKKKKKQ